MAEVVNDEDLRGLVPETVMSALPVLCIALMQNLAESDQAQLGADISKVRSEKTITADAQMRAVIIQLTKRLGEDVVKKVMANAHSIFIEPPPVIVQPSVREVAIESPQVREAVLEQARELGPSTGAPPAGEPSDSETTP